MAKQERKRIHNNSLYDDVWYEALGLSAIERDPRVPKSNEEIDFIWNGNISPFTRYMFIHASYNFAEKASKFLTESEREQVIRELEEYTHIDAFSGRFWMRVSILEFFAESPAFIDISEILPGMSLYLVNRLSEMLDLTAEQQQKLSDIERKTRTYFAQGKTVTTPEK